ncbi:uncharacterized protein LOC143452346 isoform X2 [Clavelina lepadiformis]|uniref:uncharacterized protein LOC143452346 isoform X2 n=1 Tax=Clavelina lepadiformis TaxID=159417 RepID=UPI0040426B46
MEEKQCSSKNFSQTTSRHHYQDLSSDTDSDIPSTSKFQRKSRCHRRHFSDSDSDLSSVSCYHNRPLQTLYLFGGRKENFGKDQDNIYEIFPVIQIHKNLVNIGKNQNVIIDIYVTSIQICLLRHTLVNLR